MSTRRSVQARLRRLEQARGGYELRETIIGPDGDEWLRVTHVLPSGAAYHVDVPPTLSIKEWALRCQRYLEWKRAEEAVKRANGEMNPLNCHSAANVRTLT